MALTLTRRLANAADVDFIVKMGNRALEGNQGSPTFNRDAALTYITGEFRTGVVLATDPALGLSNALLGASVVYLGKKPDLWVQVFALDDDVIADIPANAAARRRAADRTLSFGLNFALNNGFTTAKTRRIWQGGKMAVYLQTITPPATRVTNAEGNFDYQTDIQTMVNFLDARSPS